MQGPIDVMGWKKECSLPVSQSGRPPDWKAMSNIYPRFTGIAPVVAHKEARWNFKKNCYGTSNATAQLRVEVDPFAGFMCSFQSDWPIKPQHHPEAHQILWPISSIRCFQYQILTEAKRILCGSTNRASPQFSSAGTFSVIITGLPNKVWAIGWAIDPAIPGIR